jgi:hypothetical protein
MRMVAEPATPDLTAVIHKGLAGLAKHQLLPAEAAATEPEAGAETAGDNGSRETR